MKGKEDSLQIAVATYLKLQYPHALWWHTPNGGSRNAIEAAKLKRMGVLAGVPDIVIVYYSDMICLELKIKPNKQTDTQKEFEKKITAYGHPYAVCYNIDEAKEFIDKYLGSEDLY